MARASDDGRRRVSDSPALPAGATPQVCVAAWHGVLHWLHYNDEPVTTCVVGQHTQDCWPVVTTVSAATSLAQLLAEVNAQWLPAVEERLELHDPAYAELRRGNTIWLTTGLTEEAAECAVIRGGNSWHLSCSASRYSEAYQRFLMNLWHQLVVALIERPDSLLSAQAYAGAGDTRGELRSGMVGPVVAVTGNLVRRFAAWVAVTPDKPAVIDDRGSISFAELDTLSDAWAQALRASGARSGGYVGVAFGRGRAMVAAQLAVLKTGAAFVPMDATQPTTRLQAMAEDTDMSLVLGDVAAVSIFRDALPGVSCLVADELPEVRGALPDSVASLGTEDLAYVIFTSGSTGKPKGVKVSHGNLLNFVVHLSGWIEATDVLSQFAPFTFDASVAEIHTSLLNGATLVILSAALIDDPDRLQAYLNEQGVSFAAFPPQYAQHVSPAKLPRLKTLLTAGSAPDHALVGRWQPHLRYINAYGPTETTILSTAWQASRVPGAHEPIVIGTPISNTEIRVVNRFNQLLPRGVIGELLIGGAGVTHGYIKRDELTGERFITLDGTRFYRSGDLACLDAEDQLIFCGRVDNQIKLRGHRLEPGEVETALLAIDGIRQAAVALVDVAAAKQLVAFCVGAPQPYEELRRRLGLMLPAWALPNRMVWIERLPLTPNGKIDYGSLFASLLPVDTPAEPADYADALEEEIAAIWRSVLQQPRILRDDSFIHLGGDSLTALVVTSAVKRLGYQPTSVQLLLHPRLADYARLLRAGGQRFERSYASCQGAAPLAPIQGWFFSLQLAHPGSFCQSLVFDSDARIDVDRLAQDLVRLVGYHDQLRAYFVPDTQARGGWRQEIRPAAMPLPALTVIELADTQLDATSAACSRRLAAELRIDVAPLFRLAVLHTPQRSRVVWVLHHLIVDTVSHGILLDDLYRLYHSGEADLTQVLPGKSIAYGDWAGRLQNRVAGFFRQLLEQWRPMLDEAAQALPLARGSAAANPVVVCAAHLSQEETTRLVEEATRCYRQSPEELVLAATYWALARTFNLHRIAIDIEWHGRDEELAGPQGIDRSVGWFTSVHPLVMAVPLDQDLGSWLMALKEARAAIPHRGREFYALRYLSPDAEVRAAFARYRQPDVLFNFSGVVQRRHGGWRSVPVVAIEMGDGNAHPYALSVESELRDGELIISCYSQRESWPEEAIERLGLMLSESLRAVIRHCCTEGKRRWTPSDFPQLALTQAQVDELPQAIRAAYPLTDMQQTMWRHKDTYQVFMCYRMPRRFNERLWSLAVADWVDRHDCLRTYVKEWESGEPCQVILDTLPSTTTVHRAPPGTGKSLATQLIEQGRRAPVRLEQAPLFHLQAIDEEQDDFFIVLCIHHIIHDGWSIERLLSDLLQTYRYFCREACPKPGTPLASVAELVTEQRRLRASADWQAYWSGLPWESTASELPSGTQPSTGGPPKQRNIQLYLDTIDPQLANAVRAQANAWGVTVNSLWLSGYVALLRYLGGQTQVRCGVIQSGRPEEIVGVETITGCCVNTLPLVLNISPQQALVDIVTAVNGQLEKMRAGAAYPLSSIYELVKPRLNGELFTTLFNIESHRYGGHDEQPLPTLEGGYESTGYSFIFGLIEHPGEAGAVDSAPLRYQVRIGYDADRNDSQTIATWLEIYAHCMHLMTTRADVSWDRLPLLPPRMREQLIIARNQTAHAYRQDACIHDLIAEQAARTPDAVALVYENQRLSYRALEERSNQLAQHLRTLGVGPEVIVGCCLERSIDMVVGLLGVLKAGGAYVPLDPELPPQRLGDMLADLGTPLVLTQAGGVQDRLSQVKVPLRLLRLDADWAQIGRCAATAPVTGVRPHHLAYVIFTSGSTGKPKAAMNEHGALVNRLQWMQDAYRLDATDRVLQKTPFSFDVSVWEFFWPLLAGATLVISRPGGHREPAYLGALILERGITTLHFVPSMLQVFLDEGDLGAYRSLRRVITSGEGLPAGLAARFLALSSAELHNLYGPTEAAIDVSYYAVKQAGTGTEPLGWPIWNTHLYVLDERLQPVAPGMCGELYIGGVAVGRGYLGRPDLTAERFVQSPFTSGERLYRTGDLARWRSDGALEYLGRTDHQVKIRGFRIELGEIEHAIITHENVKQALVKVRTEGGRQQLVAYLLAKKLDAKDQWQTASLIRSLVASLSARLPEYMVPAAFVILDAMPLNANGKIDHARLPEPTPAAYARDLHVEPESELERVLWSIWRECLRIETLGVTDDFYAIGGDSIIAIQVVAQARKHGLGLTPRLLVEERTIRKLVSRVQSQPLAQAAPALLPMERPVEGEQRLLPIQLQFLQEDTDVDRYGQYLLAALPEGATNDTLRSVLAALIGRHDVLRLKFRRTAGSWIAYYRPELLATTPDMMEAFFDPTAAADEFDPAVQVAQTLAQLDIRKGLLWRWRIVRCGGQRRLLWVMHHLVVDAVSWRILAADLATVLAQLGRGEVAALDTKPTSFQDWAARLYDYAYCPALLRERPYWAAQLVPPSARLRFDVPDAGGGGQPLEATTDTVEVVLGAQDSLALQQRANARYATCTQQLLVAALGATLGDWLDDDAVRIDLEGHGRQSPKDVDRFDGLDPSQTVGWFTTLYPLRLDGLRADLGAQLRRTKAQIEAVPHNGLGWGVLRLLAQDEELAAGDLPASEILFNYLGQFDTSMVGGSQISPRRRRTHALRIEGLVRDGLLSLRFDYSREQFTHGTMAALAERYAQALRELVAHCVGTADTGREEPGALAGLAPHDAAALKSRYPHYQDVFPCTGMQQGLLLLGARAPQSGLYHTQVRIELDGADPARLRHTWQVLQNRHDVLRAAFVDCGHASLLQVICERVELPWREVDGRTLRDPDALQRLLAAERTQPFDVAVAPLLRFLLVRTSDTHHCLVWTHHHVLLDGWSIGLLIKELIKIYAGAAPMAAAPSTWRHYVEWLQSRDRPAAERYWRAYLDGLDLAASASLPPTLRRSDNAVSPRRYEQALETRGLTTAATAQLLRFARAEGVGLGTLMFAAWGLLLSKYNAEPEVLFGYAISGRSAELAGSESVVGLCINSLPLRLKIDGDRVLRAWLKEIQHRQLDHDDHGHLELAEIQRCSGMRAGQAMFDSLVVVENYPLDRSVLAATANLPRIVSIEGVEQNDFALNLAVYPGECLTLKLAYRCDLFDAATIATLLQRLDLLLGEFAKGGAQTLAQVSILSEAERDRAVRQWNDTAMAYPADRALPALFEATARRHRPAVAIVCGEETWTYEYLAERVRVLSDWLAHSGVSAGSHVALSLRKEPALLAAMLAVMRLGAAYVPIAVDCPPERRTFLLADANIHCTLTRRSECGAWADDNLLYLEDCPARLADSDCRAVDVDPQATAYVIYTSGTTGTPKGVMISHRNLVNFCSWWVHAGLMKAGLRMTQFAPYTFDASAGEIFAGLLAGAELHLLADALIHDPRALSHYLCVQDIRFAAFPPAYLQQMDPELVPAELTLLTAGSAPTPELVRRWGARCHYINGYGPTETTILSSAWICPRGEAVGRTLSIGWPIANTKIYVVDRLGQLCAPGLIGEICIGGDGVAQGYLNQPELTDRQFVPDPWGSGRIYHTGDHGRWLDDGSIEFVGRRDRQVKLRGFRIELNEIENRLLAHPQVLYAAVLVRGTSGEQRLLAWVVPAHAAAGDEALIASIREFLKLSMPEYMLPQAILPVAQLPLTAHGKLDEQALPEPAASAMIGGAVVPAGTATQVRLAAIWAAVLQLRAEQIGATSDFFALGGHSLLAMRTIARVREELGADVDVAELFARPVLADLADTVDRASRSTLAPIVPIPRDGPLPLSYAQQRLWFLAQMEGASATYNVPGALRLSGPLDHAALHRALDRIVERHETLRTTFVTVDGEPRQYISAATGFALRKHDLRGRADDEQLAHLMREETDAVFDLAAGPLIRGRLLQLHDDEHVLQITMHHIVMDGWSQLVRELDALYGAYTAGAADPLPALAVQYADYATWQRQWLAGKVWQEQSDYWRRTLASAPALLELPTDRPRPAQQDYTGDLVELVFDAALTAQLKTLSGSHGTTMFMTLLAAWSVVLSRLSGQRDLVIGSPVANRAQLETEPLIGFFVNSVALRVDLSGNPTLGELLQRVKSQVLDAQRYQQLPFEHVVEIVEPPRTLAHTPVFQVMFSWQNLGLGDFALAGLQASWMHLSQGLSKFDLSLDLSELGDRIVGGFEYATALFDAATIKRQVGYLHRVVVAMVTDTELRVQSLDLLGADEHRLLESFNDTLRPELYERSWPELFDAQVARTPERIAVRCDLAQLSYRELHARARRLAAALVAHGAGPGQIVALLDQRGIDLHVMLIAVLQSGAAYLPLDPTHPSQRWLDVLREAQPLLLWVGDGLATEQSWLRGEWTDSKVRSTAELLAAEAPAAAPPYPAIDELAYVIYTSGSTGKPKGAMLEHLGLINNVLWRFEPLGLSADDVIAQTASQCFDISLWQFLCALLLGAKVLIVKNELTRDPNALLEHLAAERATVWEPVPSVLQAALPWRKPLPCLRWVMTTGEALPRELVARWFEQYPDIPIMNAYGPTECSDDVAFQLIHAPVERVLIGKALANAHLHVVDENLMLVPLGAVGELAVSGPVVGRGYLRRPDATQAAFRANPFARHARDHRLYLTGDLVRCWPDGSLEFLGRKDFQIKIRGFRIELGEIESCLTRHPAVRQAVVVARGLGQGDRQLVAYVTLDAKAGIDALTAHLRAQLPDYMLPAAIVVLDALPLNANGKVDRKELPEPTVAALARADYEAPHSDTEQTLAALWQQLLGVPQVGRGDSYFDLGGSSLLLIRMLSQLKDKGLVLSVTDVYQLRTVSACAAAIDAHRAGTTGWPLDGGWKHALVTVGEGDSARTALLLDRREMARHQELQGLLATVERTARPAFVRYSDDLGELAWQIAQSGVAALAPSPDDAALFDALRAQLRQYQDRLADAPTETSLRFSPIQHNFMSWQNRDDLAIVALDGWYAAAELQQAFAAAAAEQDLLRAARDGEQLRWRLLAADVIAAVPIPVVDLCGQNPARVDGLLQRIGAELLAAKKAGPAALAYVAAVVSLTELEHLLLLAIDHLVWDAMSAAVLQRRLQARLRGGATSLSRNYRDYVASAWQTPDAQVADLLRGTIDQSELAKTMDATRQALSRRAHEPLQILQLRVPCRADGTAAEQAFHRFKRCVSQLTGLGRYGIVLNHQGRELGAERWFDHVGLFLDKIPSAADVHTTLAQLAGKAELLQRQGIHYVGLVQAAGVEWGSTLPPMEYEVLFNFQTAAPEHSTPPDGSRLMEKLDGFRGILFEAAADADGLRVLCVFRGEVGDVKAVRDIVASSEPSEVAAPTSAAEPVGREPADFTSDPREPA